MRNAVIAVLVIVAVAGLAGGIWAWENLGPGRVCAEEHSVILEYGPDQRTYPAVQEALTRFGGFPGIRGDLPAESLMLSEEAAPEFGATLQPAPDDNDTGAARTYDIWKNSEVVQTVVLDSYPGGWVISGYGGCSPIP